MFPPFLVLLLISYSSGRLQRFSVQTEINIAGLENSWHRSSLEAERRYGRLSEQSSQPLIQQEIVRGNPAAFLLEQVFIGKVVNPDWQHQMDALFNDWQKLQQMLKSAEIQYILFLASPAGKRRSLLNNIDRSSQGIAETGVTDNTGIEHLDKLNTLLTDLEKLKWQSIERMKSFTSETHSRAEKIRFLLITIITVIAFYLIIFGITYSERRVQGRLQLHDQVAEANRELTRQNINLQIEIEERRKAEAMLERVINTIPQHIFWKNKDLIYQGCNDIFARAAGFENPEAVIGKTVRDSALAPEEIELFEAEDRRVISTGLPINHSVQKQTRPDGSIRWVEVNRIPLFDENGEAVGILGSYEDITKKVTTEKLEQEREQQLIQADKMISLGILVAGVAHEMNNPNQFIISHIEPLKRAWEGATPILNKYYLEHGDFRIGGLYYSKLKERLPGIFRNITEGTRRINSIVNELKEFSQEKPAEQLESIQVNSVVQSALTLSSNLIKKSTDHFAVDYGHDLPLITGHYQRLEQVVINLVQNACQALTSKEEAISIRTGYNRNNDTISVEIVDEGVGVESGQIGRLVDPFYTTKRDTGGIGLGLSISSNIVLNHGGKLTFRPGKKSGLATAMVLPVESVNENST